MLTYLMLLEEDADKARFQQLYEQYRGPMYRTALRYLKDEGRAQDAVHDAFVKIALHFQKISALSCMEMGVSAHNFRKKRAFFVKGATVATKCINKSRTILKRSSGSSLLVLA